MNEQNQTQSKRKIWPWILIGLGLIAAMVIGVIILFSTKNVDEVTKTDTPTEEPVEAKSDQYNWSTMNQGPYKDKISFATSSDLLNWTASDQILAEHASVPDAVIKDKTIYTYFVDVTTDKVAEKLGLIKSSDNGKTWSEKQIIKINGVANKVPVDPNAYLLPDGRIRLYFFDIEASRSGKTETNRMYSAISTNGVDFEMEAGVRFEHANIFDPCVIKVGDTWRMYIGNNTGESDMKIISATSSDGLTFQYEGVAAENATVPYVYTDGVKYYLYTAGVDIWSSNNGKTFTKIPENFQIPGKLAADPSVIKLSDDTYLMIYKTKDMTNAPVK